MQRSFARGKEYGGWIMEDGSIEMRYQDATREGMDLGFKPDGAKGSFHTHPNLSSTHEAKPWILQHTTQDLALNNAVYKTLSYVFGRQNVFSQYMILNQYHFLIVNHLTLIDLTPIILNDENL